MPQNNYYDHWLMDDDEEPVIDDDPETHPHFHTDEELEKCVRELLHNSRRDYSGIQVSVDARNVHFTGTLSADDDRKHLDELAGMVQGIGSVTNDVTLKH